MPAHLAHSLFLPVHKTSLKRVKPASIRSIFRLFSPTPNIEYKQPQCFGWTEMRSFTCSYELTATASARSATLEQQNVELREENARLKADLTRALAMFGDRLEAKNQELQVEFSLTVQESFQETSILAVF